jgi:hypothetical protein
VLGRPWKPYQRYIADVAGELLPTGEYAYPVVIVWLPRQTGKTTVVYDELLGRGRMYANYRCRYSTHKGTITSERFADWFLELERNPRLMDQLKLRKSRGSEGVLWKARGSYFQAFPARDSALRSAALDAVVVDEAQEHDEILGEALKRTITPTFSTRRRRQLWIVLTAGTDSSTYAADYIGRALAGEPGVALFDYGCPDDVDPYDETRWHTWHPGLAYGLTDHAALRVALAEGRDSFESEYANRWRRMRRRLVNPDAWRAVALPPDATRPAGRLCLSVHVEADRSLTAIGVGAAGGYLELVELRPGVDWAAGRILELQAAHGAPVALDRHGATGTVAEALELAGATTVPMRALDVANATAGLLDAIASHAVRIYPAAALDEAVPGAATRRLGDTGGMAFSHRDSATPVAPLVALAHARWGYEHLAPPEIRPAVFAE